jgi:hypothetical protein
VTRDEFLERKASLCCRHCGTVGLEAEENANNGGMRPICRRCGSRGLRCSDYEWLPKTAQKRPRRAGLVSTREVWEANGNHCSFCGKSRALCERLGIGLTAQHVVPFAEAGDEWPLIPFCSRCQQQSAAALAETRRVQETVGGLDEIIQRIQKNNPELLG